MKLSCLYSESLISSDPGFLAGNAGNNRAA